MPNADRMPRGPGIYAIVCLVTGKRYVGSAINIYRRWHAYHLPDLRLNKHQNTYLQRAWNKYSESQFEIVVVELVSNLKHLVKREQYWIDFLNTGSRKYGYNLRKYAGSSLGQKQTYSAKQAIAESNAKEYIVREPNGKEYTIFNLSSFCREHHLTVQGMSKVAHGRATHHKHWECREPPQTRDEWLAVVAVTASTPRPTLFDEHGNKWCGRCKQYLSPKHFNKDRNTTTGLSCYCGACRTLKNADTYAGHRRKRLQDAAVYRDENRELINEKSNIRYHIKVKNKSS